MNLFFLGHSVQTPDDSALIGFGYLENPVLIKKGRSAGKEGEKAVTEILLAEKDDGPLAGPEKIARIVQSIGRDQNEVSLVDIMNGIIDQKAAGSAFDIKELKPFMAVMTSHDKFACANSGVDFYALDGGAMDRCLSRIHSCTSLDGKSVII